MHAPGAVTDEEVINIRRTVYVLIEGVDYFVNFKTKRVTDNIQPCGIPVSWSDSVDPSLTLKCLFLRKFEMKVGRFPLRLTSCRSDRSRCFHVVSDAFFKSQKTATTFSLLIKASLMKVYIQLLFQKRVGWSLSPCHLDS